MDKRPFTCCFTGHRNLPAEQEEEIWRRVHTCLEPLLEEGVRYFGVGGSSCCIAWCTRATGGTAYTLRYAQKQGLRVWNVVESELFK